VGKEGRKRLPRRVKAKAVTFIVRIDHGTALKVSDFRVLRALRQYGFGRTQRTSFIPAARPAAAPEEKNECVSSS
jgi:hypothetical protein